VANAIRPDWVVTVATPSHEGSPIAGIKLERRQSWFGQREADGSRPCSDPGMRRQDNANCITDDAVCHRAQGGRRCKPLHHQRSLGSYQQIGQDC